MIYKQNRILKNLFVFFLILLHSNFLKISMPKIILTILFFFCLTSFSQQKNYSISGIIKDSKSKTPIEYASVVLFHLPDTTLLNGVITNNDGSFKLQNVSTGNYLMKINFMGYHQMIFQLNRRISRPTYPQLNPYINLIDQLTYETMKWISIRISLLGKVM